MKNREEKKILVSVVIPAYQSAKTIGRALDSVLKQNVPLEVLVIDDGSTDETKEIVDAYQKKDDRIRYSRNEKNLGPSAGRNKGVQMAKGEYVAFLDADDYWAEEKLALQLDRIQETGDVLCCTARKLICQEAPEKERKIPVPERITYRQLLKGNVINCSSVLAKRSVLLEFPMEHDACHEDYLNWLRILQKYHTACGVNRPLLYYSLGSTGKSGSKLHSAGMTYQVYRQMGFGRVRSFYYFCFYAFYGVKKYYGKQ